MGNGRNGYKWTNAYKTTYNSVPKKDASEKCINRNNIYEYAQALGYNLNVGKISANRYNTQIKSYLENLEKLQNAMELSESIIHEVGGNLKFERLSSERIGGRATADGDIIMNQTIIQHPHMSVVLPHEFTHQLAHFLVSKEYSRGSYLYYKAIADGIMEQNINGESLIRLNSDADSGKLDIKYKSYDTYEATKLSGMRKYARHDYSWAPKGAGLEIPTVAAEEFVKAGYNWNTLKQNSPYSYYVLQELKRRLSKIK